MIEDALQTRLSAVTALTSLVSTRIYYAQLPQEVTLPAVTYLVVGERAEHTMGSDTGIVRLRVQVDSWGRDQASSPGIDQARDVDAAVVTALNRFRGTVSPSSGDVEILDIFRESVREKYEKDTRIWRRSRDFEVIYRE